MKKFDDAAQLIKDAKHVIVITGAGMSTDAGIPDLAKLSASGRGYGLFSESRLVNNPKLFSSEIKACFFEPIFKNGPTVGHKILGQWESKGIIDGIVTTNVDYLHEIAGSKNIADIWSNLNINYCINCHQEYDMSIWHEDIPTCKKCGGLISPSPVYHHIGIDSVEYAKASMIMKDADLVITIGANGFYSNVPDGANLINIDISDNFFSERADIFLKGHANDVLSKLDDKIY